MSFLSFFDAGTPAMGCSPAHPSAPECIPSSGTPTTFAGEAPWTFKVVSPGARLTVTDAFYHGDAFDIFDLGTLIGSTIPWMFMPLLSSNWWKAETRQAPG